MNDFQFGIGMSFAILGSLFCLTGIIMRISQKVLLRDKANCVICIGVFTLLWHLLIYCLIYTGNIITFPQLYNKGIPFYYLAAPCFYFYVNFTLNPSSSFSRYSYLHLVPFALGLIDIIPYTFASANEQQTLLRLVVSDLQAGFKHSYGFIDQKWHYILRFALAIIYVIAQWQLIYNFDDLEEEKLLQNRKKAVVFSTIYSCYLLFQCSMVLAIILNRQQGSFILRDIDNLIVVSFFFFLFSIWFITNSVQTIKQTKQF